VKVVAAGDGCEDFLTAECGEFLAEWGFVQKHGLMAWIEINGRPHILFVHAMNVMDEVLSGLEHSDRAAWARRERRRRADGRTRS
jgi:hypothetical protein